MTIPDQPEVEITRNEYWSDGRGGRTRPHITPADDDKISSTQCSFGGVGETTKKIANHRHSMTVAKIDVGIHQLVPTASVGKHAYSAMPRKRLTHSRPSKSTVSTVL